MTAENLKRGWDLLDLIKRKRGEIDNLKEIEKVSIVPNDDRGMPIFFNTLYYIEIDFAALKVNALIKLNIELAELEKEFDEL